MVIVVRVALLLFLVWALVSARTLENTPVAEDAGPSSQDNRRAVEPQTAPPDHLG
jgi:hypothetical protein